jgi:hypothetical protein
VAVIHPTTLVPSKLELLTAWLPSRPWYRGRGTPNLAKAGGFRLDDPAGEVGIEFAFVTDDSTGAPVAVAQLLALLAGAAVPQAQSVSETPKPAVTVAGSVALDGPVDVTDDEDGTHLTVGGSVIRLIRNCSAPPESAGALAVVAAPWVLPDGDIRRGPVVVVT